MKNSLAIVILATMLSCCGRAGQSPLEKAEESPDKLARLEAVEYYKERGTANERMKAHYLLGCVYRDLHWQNEAVTSFYKAIGAADTLAANCDFALLTHIYGELADLLAGQAPPGFFRAVAGQMEKFAWLSNDTLATAEAQRKRELYNQELWEHRKRIYSETALTELEPFSEERLAELQAYSRIENELEKRLHSEQRVRTVRNGIFLFGVLLVVLGLLLHIQHLRQKKLLLDLTLRNDSIAHQLELLKSQPDSQTAQSQIAQLESERESLIARLSPDEIIQMKIARVQATPVCNRFFSLYREEKKPTAEDWAALEQAVGESFPDVTDLLGRHLLNEKEHRICLLLCADFKPKQIHFFLQTAPGTTTSIRHRLGAKLFGVDCGAKEFDRLLLSFSRKA